MKPKQLNQRKMEKVTKSRNKSVFRCEMCGKSAMTYQYKLPMILTDTIMKVCGNCAYRETYGTKNMKKAMKEGLIEEEKTN